MDDLSALEAAEQAAADAVAVFEAENVQVQADLKERRRVVNDAYRAAAAAVASAHAAMASPDRPDGPTIAGI